MSLWTDIRDTAESAAVLAGNYVLPGSSLVTSKLVSEGSQKQLGSTVGQLAQLGTGGYGAYEGNLANYGTAYDKVTGAFGGSTGTTTGADAVKAFESGKISAAEFEALATGAGTTGSSWLSGAGLGATLSKFATPAAIFASSLIGADAAKSAAATQAQASAEANKIAYQIYQEQKALQEPWRAAGVNALAEMQKTAGNVPAPFEFKNEAMYRDPGYAFRLAEGQKALERSATARGGLLSGATGKALERFGQDYASNEYTNAYNRALTGYNANVNRENTLYNRQAGLAGIGQTATGAIGSNAGTYGATAGSNLTSGAAATAAGNVGATNAITGGLNTYLNYASNQDLTNALLRRSTYGAPTA